MNRELEKILGVDMGEKTFQNKTFIDGGLWDSQHSHTNYLGLNIEAPPYVMLPCGLQVHVPNKHKGLLTFFIVTWKIQMAELHQ